MEVSRKGKMSPLAQATEKLYECSYCDFTSRHKTDAQRHELTHAPPEEKQFQCDHCSYATHFEDRLKKHQRVHTGEKPYKCPVCEKRFRWQQYVQTHVKQVHEKQNLVRLKCTRCDFTSNWKAHMLQHERVHHQTGGSYIQGIDNDGDDGDGIKHVRGSCEAPSPYTCGLCSISFKHHSYLQRHVMSHTGEMPFQCSICGKGFIQKFSLTRHALSHSDKPAPIKCDRCDARFNRKYQLESHNIREHGEERFQCKKCDKSFTQKKHLRAHEKEQGHQENLLLQCNHCSLKFMDRHQLSTHKKTHRDLSPVKVKCSKCDKTFPKNSLLEHERRHIMGRPFSCTHCSKNYKTPGDLQQHMRLTHGAVKRVKQLSCKFCDYKAGLKRLMDAHEAKHLNPKPFFACLLCSKEFKTEQKWRAHVKQMHSEEAQFKREN